MPKKDYARLADYQDIIDKKIKCRRMKVLLETGEIEILCTSLDQQKYKIEGFGLLYPFENVSSLENEREF